MTLYEIKEEILKAMENVKVNEETGEVEGFDELDTLNETLADKLESCAIYYKGLLAEIDAHKAEMKRQKEWIDSLEGKADSFKRYIDGNLVALDMQEFKTAKCSVTYRKSTSVAITDENAIPKEYMREEVKRTPDKVAIRDAFKRGEEVKGAEIVVESKLQIK